MSFDSLRKRTAQRYNEVQVLINSIRQNEPKTRTDPLPIDLKIVKGLFYVHLYAAFEKSINDSVETALLLIAARNVKMNHLSPNLLPIVLHDELKSLKDGAHAKILLKSSSIFSDCYSSTVRQINETIFSSQLQNVWIRTIEEIFVILGVSDLTLSKQARTTIDEVVDRRNAVAHGRESAVSVGEKQTSDSLASKFQIISDATQQVIDALERHQSNRAFIKPHSKRHYPT